MEKNYKKYIVFWLSQAISQLGSQMTGFALISWAYGQHNSAMTVSLMSFFNYVPYILVSVVAGSFVDSHRKKSIMLAADSIAALCSVTVLGLGLSGALQIYHIYMINFVLGLMNAFQGPASAVAVGKMVPKEKIAKVSGMNSFSDNLVMVLAPVLASALYGFYGLGLILAVDLVSFAIAFFVLLVFIQIPEENLAKKESKGIFAGCGEGFRYLIRNKAIFTIIITMALLNFFSRLTYENILSPMILARSGNNSFALGMVNSLMGIGGILGGVIVASGKWNGSSVKMIYFSAMLSFLLGDLMMGLGQNVVLWSFAGLMASLPIPFINAGQNVIFYEHVQCIYRGGFLPSAMRFSLAPYPLGFWQGAFLRIMCLSLLCERTTA